MEGEGAAGQGMARGLGWGLRRRIDPAGFGLRIARNWIWVWYGMIWYGNSVGLMKWTSVGSGDVGRSKKISMLDRPLPRLLYSLFVLIHPSFSSPSPLSLTGFPWVWRFGSCFSSFLLGFFSSRGPFFSSILFFRSSTRASKHVRDRNPGVSSLFLEPVCFRARESRRGRPRCHEWVLYANLLWGVGKMGLARFLWMR